MKLLTSILPHDKENNFV